MKRTKQHNKVDLFLDSGAYSAMTQGAPIDINEYINFIKDNKDVINIYANLDVITGKAGPGPISAELTLKNQRIMEKAGLSPIPTFHIGEPFSYLEDYVNNYDYIALGGVAKVPTSKMLTWLDICFSKYICDENGMPRCKVHGFAVTSLKLMLRYPWYSVDSTSWVATGRMGSIYMPIKKSHGWDYLQDNLKIPVSSKSPLLNQKGKHFQTMSKGQQKVILDYLEFTGFKMGSSSFKKIDQDTILAPDMLWAEKKPKEKGSKRLVEIIHEDGVSTRYQLRDQLNIKYFLDLEKQIQPWPWAFIPSNKGKGLF